MKHLYAKGDCYALSKCIAKRSIMRYTSLLAVALFMCLTAHGQGAPRVLPITGTVVDTIGQPIAGATVSIINTPIQTQTDEYGRFSLRSASGQGTLRVRFVGYQTAEVPFGEDTAGPILIALIPTENLIDEVEVSTGYQTIPKERATGSFVHIDNELLNRKIGANILQRLDGIAPGVYFSAQSDYRGSDEPRRLSENRNNINIRGIATYHASTEPLIVVDNFPFEGDINNINPNDVESVTVLKDAAAASIWGARAGNGVIVITTKTGRGAGGPSIDMNTNFTFVDKPNLFYDQNYLRAPDYIEVEQYLFDRGFFNANLNNTTSHPYISPVVAALEEARHSGQGAEAERLLTMLSGRDIREDYSKYVYRNKFDQQYSVGIRGGGDSYDYTLSFGNDRSNEELVRNSRRRTTVNFLGTVKPTARLQLTAGMNYSDSEVSNHNAFRYGTYNAVGGNYSALHPYQQLADESGEPMPVPRGLDDSYLALMEGLGLFDWRIRPLDEIALADRTVDIKSLLLRASAKYRVMDGLSVDVYYQRQSREVRAVNNQREESYDVRHQINRFSSLSGADGGVEHVFPLGGIYQSELSEWNTQNLRGQADYRVSSHAHDLSVLAGMEVRATDTELESMTRLGYKHHLGTSRANLDFSRSYPVNPSGSSFLPLPYSAISGNTNRYVSYYASVGYAYLNRYTASLSGRKDGANLFGAKANNKFTPLWSVGVGWLLSDEAFYDVYWVPHLKVRASYGYNGNIYDNGSAYLVGAYFTDSRSGFPSIANTSAPNPELRWERVRNVNLGLDFKLRNDRISGTLEFYTKRGKDLIQPTVIAPQTGFATYYANVAETKTTGVDVSLASRNLTGSVRWGTTLLLSCVDDYVVRYDAIRTSGSIQAAGGVTGRSLHAIHSYRWYGLNPENGNPRGFLNGSLSEDYVGIVNNFNPDSLTYSGVLRPPVFGALRNDISYKRFGISINVVYKLGHVFRKPTVNLNYAAMLTTGQHADYGMRWKNPGDENHTYVPSLAYPSNNNRNTFYRYSEVLVQRADLVRLQDIRLWYDFGNDNIPIKGISNIQMYLYANNLMVLWRANEEGIDPEATSYGSYPNPVSVSMGLRFSLR